MSSVSFFNNRQLGIKTRTSFGGCYSSFNFDGVLSRLACYRKDIFTIRGEDCDLPPFVCKFGKDVQSDLLAVANEDGDILLYNTSEKNQATLLKSFTAHNNAIFDLCWVHGKSEVISGSGDHSASVWDITGCKCISVFKNHSASVKTVDVCPEQSAIFATGSRDGNINIWDIREKNSSVHVKPVIGICQAHCRKNIVTGKKRGQKDPVSSVSSVAFQDCNNLASAGVADGAIKIWDLRKTYVSNSKYLPSPRYQMNYSESKNSGHGCTSIVFDSLYKYLYACITNSKILKFDCHSYAKEVVESYQGFHCETYFVKISLSSDDQYLLSGSSDDKAYIWKVSKPGLPILQLPGHSSEVTSVCWSSYDNTKLATCGDDNNVAIWKIANTENSSINNDIHAVVEPFSGKQAISSPPITNQKSSIIAPNTASKRSPLEFLQTPSKPTRRVITSFFSPVTTCSVQTSVKETENEVTVSGNDALNSINKLPTTCSVQTSVKETENKVTVNGNDALNSINKLPTTCSVQTSVKDTQNGVTVNGNDALNSTYKLPNSPTADATVLTPSKHVNNNILCKSPIDTLEIYTRPEDKNLTPELKNAGTNVFSSSSIQNKENASSDISPETVNKIDNICQTKRKLVTNHSTPNSKRKQPENSNKSKKSAKMDKKTPPGKTIMNYFSVVLSPDK